MIYVLCILLWGCATQQDMGDEYAEKAYEILSRGCSHPKIFGDDTITKGLIDYGVDVSEARNYIHSTCVEIPPVGASNVWVASPYTNMALVTHSSSESSALSALPIVMTVSSSLKSMFHSALLVMFDKISSTTVFFALAGRVTESFLSAK